MYIVLAVLGLLAALAGLLMLTQATTGVGAIAFGVFLVALARVIQAERHHSKTMGE